MNHNVAQLCRNPARNAGDLMPIEQMAAQFDAISLDEMANVSLLNRVDTKYLMGLSHLEAILPHLMQQYRVLCIDQVRLNHYETLYFDTNDLALYRQHHNGTGSRYKVRARRYVESDQAFFEVKHKTNQDRTVKSRMPIPGLTAQVQAAISSFIGAHTPLSADLLEPKLWNEYLRMTLVSEDRPERVTLDFHLKFGRGSTVVTLPGIAIAEVKREHLTQDSAFTQQMRQHGIHPASFSKYCAGVWMLYESIKVNNFKPQMHQLHKVIQEEMQHDTMD